jgi:SAM-dependent MidA family methyltransferase
LKPALPQIIRAKIAADGPLTFETFMELALYCPDCGYYEKEGDNVGRGGDFYTSVSVGALFGELLAFQFCEWWRSSGTGRLRVIEAGAHNGQLAADILRWIEVQRPDRLPQVDYVLMEPSRRRRAWQTQTLLPWSGRVSWSATWPVPQPRADTFTILFANELLDAMPVRRLGWSRAQQAWFEWGVDWTGEAFDWTRLPLKQRGPTLALPSDARLLEVLPEDFTVERCLAAEHWWRAAAEQLDNGRLVTFDYGYPPEESLSANRPAGTVRSYRAHQQTSSVLTDPGEQDLTAHVDWGRIERTGLEAGLVTEELCPQGRWLARVAAATVPASAGFGEWTPSRSRQLMTLTHPQHLGVNFQVLVQRR